MTNDSRYAQAMQRVLQRGETQVASLVRELGEDPDAPPSSDLTSVEDGGTHRREYQGVIVHVDDFVITMADPAVATAFAAEDVPGTYPVTDLYLWLGNRAGQTGRLVITARWEVDRELT